MKVFSLGILIFALSWCQSQAAPQTDAPQTTINNITASLSRNEVGRLEVLQIPQRVLTRTRVTSEMLEHSFHYKLTVADLRGAPFAEDFQRILKSVKVKPTQTSPDLRWALILYKLDGNRLASIYLDGAGDRGFVNAAPVDFDGDLLSWIERTLGKSFH